MTGTTLFLDVRVNDWPLKLVARFRDTDGRLSLPADQFEGLGFLLDEAFVTTEDGERRVYLDQVPGLEWRIDQRAQTIDITAPFDRLKPNLISVSPGVPRIPSRADWGAMLSYDLFGEWSEKPDDPDLARTVSINLDARLFSPWFSAFSTGYYTTTEGGEDEFVRLESWVDFDSTESAWRLRLGDSYTAGPIWVRPFRFGGIQWMTDFSLRPDVVTTPMPELNQDIAVPSSVDLFINGVQRYSRAVEPGALRLTDLPIVSGANSISVVVTDQAGRRTQMILPLYSSTLLLAQGMSTFNVEAGLARQNFSLQSNDYEGTFASGNFRYGVNDDLTVTGYAAVAKDYVTGAGGAAFAVGDLFVAEATALVSDAPTGTGWAWFLGVERVASRFNFTGRYIENHGYHDLADLFGYTTYKRKALASIGVNMDRAGQLNLTYASQEELDGGRSTVASGTWGIDLFRNQIHVSTSAFAELEDDSWGVVLAASFPLGGGVQAYAQETWRDNDQRATFAQVRGEAFNQRLTWQIEGTEGDFERFDAQADWEGRFANLHLAATEIEGSAGYQAGVVQSFVFMDGQAYVAGRLDDAFAVVEVENSPGVRVALENRTIGRTNDRGRLFLPGLQSYAPNAISIEPLDLPPDASIRDSATLVSPRGGAGLVTRFAVDHARSAIVTVRMPDGSAPPVGARVRIAGVEDPAVSGFDGEIYVRGLQNGENRLELSWREGACSVTFTAEVVEGSLPRLGPFTCAP
ncbi:fimbria/pilus outer membrane usher protein [Brevundimonas lenta]|uniref:Outer membrane usher protein n=1 Tax=Brevundimonas lenta TaxID=424796 RepID=A0A7W6NQT2_9CAUL|nr:outer membrane usher protein [Brevundimonas lenta]